MIAIDEDFSKGIVCGEDVEEWLAGEGPLQAYRSVCDLWDVHIKPPKMSLGERTEYNYVESPQKVTIDPAMALAWAKMFEENGGSQPFSSLLKADLAEQMTYYISFNVNPEQQEREAMLLDKFQQNRSIDDFIEYATQACKMQAVGFIGRSRVATDLGIKGYAEKSNRIADSIASNNDLLLLKAIKMVGAELLPVDYLRELTPFLLRNTTAGTGESVLAAKLEKQYEGRLPMLIREDGCAPFKSEYVEYVRKNTPAYGDLINANFHSKLF